MSIINDIQGNRRILARAISIAEDGGPEAVRLMSAIFAATGRAAVVGVTGPPVAGKSTLVNALALELLQRGTPRIAILAVDPSSPFGGGAILGDRIRMQALAGNPAIYIRSMSSRGQMGGLARATADVIRVLDAAGFPLILVETVGVGQAEVEIAREAHTVVLVQAPGLGDDVQAIKAGILEIADVLVVNKADQEGANQARRHLQMMQNLGGEPRDGWRAPIIPTVAPTGIGLTELATAIAEHRAHQERHGLLAARERRRAEYMLEALLHDRVLELVRSRLNPEQYAAAIEQVLTRSRDPLNAAEQLLHHAFKANDAGDDPLGEAGAFLCA